MTSPTPDILKEVQRYLQEHHAEIHIYGMTLTEVYMMMQEVQALRGNQPMMSLSTVEDMLRSLGYEPKLVLKDWAFGKEIGKRLTIQLEEK